MASKEVGWTIPGSAILDTPYLKGTFYTTKTSKGRAKTASVSPELSPVSRGLWIGDISFFFKPVDIVANLQGRPHLKPHVLDHHVTPEQ